MMEYLLALLPFYESRYTIPLLILKGENPILAFILSSLLNLLVYPFIILFLNKIHPYLLKVNIYNKIYLKIINYTIKKRDIIDKYSYLGLFLFVFLPLPTTGVYAASLLSWLLNLDKKKAFVSIALGVFSINSLITLASLGIFKTFLI